VTAEANHKNLVSNLITAVAEAQPKTIQDWGRKIRSVSSELQQY
jgi:hypothetical protein